MRDVLDAVNEGWNWCGLNATAVHAVSPMGHLLLSDDEGCFYYLDTDGMELTPLGDEGAAKAHFDKDETREIWQATALVEGARQRLGNPPEGSVFTLSPMHWIDGQYSVDNMAMLPLAEIVFLSGDIARQLKDLPDGAQVRIEIGQ